ncbi:MAG TPA: hypothetical protein PLX23_03170 [Candidatus Hydrogenedens sp.]|nr:hypothetical protein [Candidatus Hydrogenedens sp.]
MKYKFILVSIILISIVVSIYGGYKTTLFLFSNYTKPLSIPADDLEVYKGLYLSISLLTELLVEYHKRMEDKGDTFAATERQWINQTFQPTLTEIRNNLLNKSNQKSHHSEKTDNLLRQFQYQYERINTMLQFPGDTSLKKAVYLDFLHYVKSIDDNIKSSNLQNMFQLDKIILKLEKTL